MFKFKKYAIGMTGLMPSPPDNRDIALSSVSPTIKRYPEAFPPPFDLTISNQKNKPHCVGFSCATIKQAQEFREQENVVFNGDEIYAECKKIDGIPNFNGTYLRVGLKVLQKVGAKANGKIYQIAGYARVDDNSFEGLKKAITLHGELLAGFTGSNQGWASEIVRPPKSGETTWNHAVALIGYEKNYIIGQNSWGCFDNKTEILTKNGWKLFKDINEKEIVATLNPKTHKLEYHQIKSKFVYNYDGYLWNYKARDIDLLITPNHKIYIQPKHRNKWMLLEADKVWIKGFRMKKDAKWEGRDIKYFQVGEEKISMDLWLEFLGYFISEGNVGNYDRLVKGRNKTRTTYTIVISQEKGKKADKIKRCLNKMPLSFSYYGHSFIGSNKSICKELKPLGKSYEKYIPNYVKELSPRQLKIFLNALMLGDGSGSPTKKWTYYTSSKKLADDVQEILLKIGYAGDVSFTDRRGRDISNERGKNITRFIEYAVGIKTKELTPRNEWKPELIPYREKVYCVEAPNHIVYVRRNGKAVWSGNSNAHNNGIFKVPANYLPFEAWTTLDKPNTHAEPIKTGWVASEFLTFSGGQIKVNAKVGLRVRTTPKILPNNTIKILPFGTVIQLTNNEPVKDIQYNWVEVIV